MLYLLRCNDGNVYDEAAYGFRGLPVFADESEAIAFRGECEASWRPADGPDYGIEQYADADQLLASYDRGRLSPRDAGAIDALPGETAD